MTAEHQSPTTTRSATPHSLSAHGARAHDEWAKLWFAAQQQPWQTLVLVPAARGTSSIGAARALLDVAKEYHLLAVRLLDATGVRPEDVAAKIAEMADSVALGERVIVAIDCPLSNPSAIPIARAASVAVMLVPLGVAKTQDAQQSIDIVGRDRFIGSVAMRPRP